MNVHRFGNNVNTDDIIAGKYKHATLDIRELATHVMEASDPSFIERFKSGDIIVAGDNFGCGSSREQAPRALKELGCTAILAKSFARLFFRNAMNIGLPVFNVDLTKLGDGQQCSIRTNSI